MTSRKGHKYLIVAAFVLALFTTASVGRALHTHSSEYYRAVNAAAHGDAVFVDDCPICHFQLCLSMPAEQPQLDVQFVLLCAAPCPRQVRGVECLLTHRSLRAPPVLG